LADDRTARGAISHAARPKLAFARFRHRRIHLNYLELALLIPGDNAAPNFDPTKTGSVIISSAVKVSSDGLAVISFGIYIMQKTDSIEITYRQSQA